jgi:hypothetical protein
LVSEELSDLTIETLLFQPTQPHPASRFRSVNPVKLKHLMTTNDLYLTKPSHFFEPPLLIVHCDNIVTMTWSVTDLAAVAKLTGIASSGIFAGK